MDSFSPIKIAVATTEFVVSASVSGVIVSLVREYAPAASKTEKVKRYVGSYVLGAMAGAAASNYVEHKLQNAAKRWNEIKTKMHDQQVTE